MTAKKTILISAALLLVGSAAWFFFIRTRNTISEEDRTRLKSVEPVLADFDYELNAPHKPESIVTH